MRIILCYGGTSVAWLSSVRVVRRWINFLFTDVTLLFMFKLIAIFFWYKEFGMKSSQHGLDELGYTCAAEAKTMRSNNVNWSKSLNFVIWFGLFSATREHEAGIASNRISAECGESFSFLVHTARHIMEAMIV